MYIYAIPFFYFFLMAVQIVSINVNGIQERHKRLKVFSTLRAENCDIYLLQETHVQSVQEGKLWEREWGGRAIFSPGSNRSAGVGILINPRSSVEIATHKADKFGRLISARLKHNNSKFQILNVYAPNTVSDRKDFFDTFWQYTFRNVPLIVGGDFNCVPCVQKDNCNNYACFNCDQLGHYATACTDALRCSICKSTGHKAHHCPFALIDALDESLHSPFHLNPNPNLTTKTTEIWMTLQP